MSLALANQYAKALLDVVSKPVSSVNPDGVVAQLRVFEEALKDSQDLRTALLSPALSHDSKERIIARLAPSLSLGREVQRFLAVVARKRRLNLIAEMRVAFQALLDEKQGIARAQVRSATEIDAAQRELLESKLAGIGGRRVACEYSVDPSLIGGVSVQMGAKVYDGSILGQMEALERRLAGSH